MAEVKIEIEIDPLKEVQEIIESTEEKLNAFNTTDRIYYDVDYGFGNTQTSFNERTTVEIKEVMRLYYKVKLEALIEIKEKLENQQPEKI